MTTHKPIELRGSTQLCLCFSYYLTVHRLWRRSSSRRCEGRTAFRLPGLATVLLLALTAGLAPQAAHALGTLKAAPGDGKVKLTWTYTLSSPNNSGWEFRYARADQDYPQWRHSSGFPVAVDPKYELLGRRHSGKRTQTITGLTNGVEYKFQVYAKGPGRYYPEVKATLIVVTKPAAPTGLAAQPGNTQVTLSWDDPDDDSIIEYQVRQHDGSSWGRWADIDLSDADTVSHTVTGLTNGTEYRFRIRAVNDAGNGAQSLVVRATPTLQLATDPAAATQGTAISLTVTSDRALTGDLPVSLTLADRGSSGFDADDIPGTLGPRDFDASFGNTASTTGTVTIPTGTDSDTESAETYTITLNDGTGYALGVDTTADGTLNDLGTAPAKPTGLTATAGEGRATLAWDDPDDDSITIWQYQQKVDSNDYGLWIDMPDSDALTTSHVVESLTNGAIYSFKIRAVNVTGNGAESLEVTVTPLALPAAPTGFVATAGDGQVTLSWKDPQNASITSWEFRQKNILDEYGPWTPISGALTTSHVVESLTNGDTYVFQVRGVNRIGDGAESVEATARPLPPVPSKPTGFTAGPGRTRITLSWNNPGNPAITGWQVRRKEGAGNYGDWTNIPNSGATTTRHVVTGLKNGTRYTFRIRAANVGSYSPESDDAAATTITLPAKPTGFSAVGSGDGRVTLSWDNPDDPSIVGWQYRRKFTRRIPGGRTTSWDLEWTPIPDSDTTTTRHEVTGLDNETVYTFILRARDSERFGYQSDERTATPRGGVYPEPIDLTATPGNGRVILSWGNPKDPRFDNWRVRWREHPQINYGDWTPIPGSRVASQTIERHTVTGLTNNRMYDFQVAGSRGTKPEGIATVSAIPIPPPAAPTGLSATAGDTQITLSWNNPKNTSITGWEYQQQLAGAATWGAWTNMDGSGASSTSYRITGLTNGTAYGFKVRAVNPVGNGDASATVNGTPVAITPCKVRIRSALGSGVLSSSGDTSASADLIIPANCGRITGIQFQTRTLEQTWDDATTWSPIVKEGFPLATHPETRSLSDALLRFRVAPPVSTRTLLVRFRALSGQVVGPASDATRILVGAVNAPTGLRATAGDGSVTLSWNPQPGRGIRSWQYQYKSNGDWSAAVDVPGASVTAVVEGLSNNTTHTFRLRSRFGHLPTNSSWSGEVTATPTAMPPGITLSESRLTVAEGGSSDYLVALDARPAASVVVTVSGMSGDVTVDPERLTFTTGNFDVPQAVAVSADHDADALVDPVVTLTHSTLGGGYDNVDVDDVVVVVTEDDVAGVTLSESRLNAGEGGSATYSVRLDTRPSANVTVTVGGASGDVTVNPDSLIFTGSNFGDWQTVTVTAGQDGDALADPAVTLTHSASGGDYGSVTIDSVVVVVEENDAPLQPTGLRAAAGNRQVTLSWNDANNPGITKWQYQQKESAGNYGNWTDIPSSGATTNRHVVGNLTNETIYAFKLRAVNGNGDGAASAEITAMPMAPPDAPTGFGAAAGDGQVTLSWDDPGNPGITQWQYQQKEGTGNYGNWTEIPNSGAATTSYVVKNLTNGRAYAFKVRAVNPIGAGGESSEKTATPLPPAPARPANLSAAPGDRQVTLSWDNANNPGITQWQYQQKEGTGNYGDWTDIPNSRAATTSYVVGNLTNGTAYAFRIRAVNAGGNGAESDEVTATPQLGRPAAPTALRAEGSDKRVTLLWNDPNNPSITRWEFRQKSGAGTFSDTWTLISSSPTTNHHAVTGLTNGTRYTFQVRALNSVGTGPAAEVTGQPTNKPAAPAGLGAAAGNGKVTLSWSNPKDPVIDNWRVRQRRFPEVQYGDWSVISGSTGAASQTIKNHTVTGLTNNRRYDFQVAGFDSTFQGNIGTVSATPVPNPAKPTGLTAIAGDRQVTLSWNNPNNASITGWEYQQKTGSGNYGNWAAISNSDASTTRYVAMSLTNGSVYAFKVRAVNRAVNPDDEGVASNEVTATPSAKTVMVPATLAVAEGAGSATVRITASKAFDNPATFDVTYGGAATGAAEPQDGDYDNDAVTSVDFPTAATTVDIVIPITDDALDEPDETFTVTIALVGASRSGDDPELGNAVTTVTITDDDASPVLGAIDAAAVKLGQTVDIAAAATDADGDTITYTWARDSSETTPALPGTALNQARLMFTPPAVGTYTMTVTASDGNGNTDTEDVVITVFSAATVSRTSLEVAEGSSDTYTVALTSEPSGDVTLTVSDASSSDVTVTGPPIRFTASNFNVPQTITVAAAADEDTTSDPDVTLTHSATGGGYYGATIASVTVSITETTPTLGLATDPASVTEGADISLTVTSDRQLTGDLMVNLTLADRSTSGFDADDIIGSLGPRNLAASFGTTPSTTGMVLIGTNADMEAEGAETFTITLNDGTGYAVGADKTVEGALNDPATVPVKPTGFAVDPVDGQVTLSWDNPNNPSITSWQYQQKAEGGYGRWITMSGSGATTTTHTVSGLTNNVSYTFRIRAVNDVGNGAISDKVTATPVGAAGVTISPTTLTVEEKGRGEYTVKLDTAPSANVTVTVGGESGEVTVTGSPLTFTPANFGTAQTVTVNAGADEDTAEDTATLTHKALSSDTNYGASLDIDDVTVTVTDTTPTLQLATDPAAVTEGSDISLSVSSDRALTGDLPVSLTLSDRGSSGFDADDIPGTLGPRGFTASFGNTASTTGTVTIPTSTDADAEGAETYTITLNDGSGYALGTDKTADGALNDPPQSTALSIADVEALENAGTMSFRVTADPAPAAPITFSYTVTAASGDTATAGTDFTAVTAATELTIAASATTVTIAVTVTDDTLDEPDETFTVTLSDPSSGATLGDATATGTITDDDALPALSIAAPAAVMEGDSGSADMTFTVTLDAASGRAVTVDHAVDASSTAAASTDFTGGAGTLTFAAGEASKTITVSVTGDEVDEDDETVVLKLSNAGNASIATATATGTITDDDESTPGVTVSVAELTVLESSAANYTVVLNARPVGDVTVTPGSEDPGAATVSAPLTFTRFNWNRPRTVTVAAVPDGDTGDERVTVSHAVTGYGSVSTASSVLVTVTDTTPTLSLAQDPAAVTEGAAISLKVTSDKALAGGLAVSLTLADRDTSGFDADDIRGALGPRNFTAAFGATASTTGTVTIPTSTDADAEGQETYRITLNEGAGYAVDEDSNTADGTLNDGTPALATGAIQLLITDATGSEGETMSFTVAVEPVSSSPITFKYTVTTASGDTATAGADFTAVTTATEATIAANASSTTITVSVTDDALVEGDETFTVTLSEPSSGVTITDATATGTIDDDDKGIARPTSLRITAAEDAITLRWTARTDPEIDKWQYRFKNKERSWRGWNPFDVRHSTALTRSVTLNKRTTLHGGVGQYQVRAVIVVPIRPEFGGGEEETFGQWSELAEVSVVNTDHLGLEFSGGGITRTGSASVVWNASVAQGASITYGVRLSAAAVPYLDRTAVVTLTSGSGVQVSPSTLTFTRANFGNAQPVTITGAAAGSAAIEHAVRFPALALLDPAGTIAVTVTEARSHGVTISPTWVRIDEGGSGEYTVKLDTAPSANVTVAVGGASGEVTALPSALTFTPSTFGTAQTVTVSAGADEDTAEDTATLTHAAASSDTNYGSSLTIDDVSVTVTDTTPTLQLLKNPVAVTEGTAISLTVTSDRALTGDLPVSLTLSALGSSGFDADDIPGALGPRRFTASFGNTASTTGTVTIPTSADSDAEELEDYRITLNDGAGYALGDDVAAAGMLNDLPHSTALSIADVTAAEDGTFTFTVTAAPAPSSEVTFKYTVTAASGDTATAGTDFTAVATATAATIAADTSSTTITVSVTDDTLDEGDETFTVTLSAPSSGVAISDFTATGTITDNDDPPALSIAAPVAVTEGDRGDTAMTFTVTLDAASGRKVTVAHAVAAASTATADTDFTGGAGTLTFAAGDTSKTITVTVKGDEVDEADETVALTLSSPTNATIATATGTGTITDDDTAGVTVSPTSLTVEEGSNGSYTVKLDSEPTADVAVAVGGASGEVTVSGSPLTFTSSNYDTAQTVTVNAGSDTDTTNDAATLTHAASSTDTNYGAALDIDDVSVTVTDTTTPGVATVPCKIAISSLSQRVTSLSTVLVVTISVPANCGPTTKVEMQLKTAAQAWSDLSDWISGWNLALSNSEQTQTFLRTYNLTYTLGVPKTGLVHVRLRALNGAVPGPASVGGHIWLGPLAQPAGLQALAGNKHVKLSWTDAANPTLTGWEYRQKSGGGSYGEWTTIAGAGAVTTGYSVPGLSNGTAYTFRIRSRSGSAASAASAEVTATPTARVPMQPELTSSEAGDGQVRVIWRALGDPSVTTWQVRRKLDSASNWPGTWMNIAGADAATTSYTFTGLTNETAYTFQVRAVNDQGAGAASTGLSATPSVEPFARPTGVGAKAGNGQVTLSWTDPGNASIMKWQYRWKLASASAWGAAMDVSGSDAETTSVVVTGLTNSAAYHFQVRAFGTQGGHWSARVSATPLTPPGAARNLSGREGDGQVTLQWINDGDTTIISWEYRQKAAGGSYGEWMTIDDSGTKPTTHDVMHTVTGLENGTAYTFQVRAENAGGKGPSAEVTATPVRDRVEAPTGFTAKPGNGRVTLSWNSSDDDRISRWNYRQKAGVGEYGNWRAVPGGASTTSHTVTGLTNDTKYTFQVRAESTNGEFGTLTAGITVTPTAPTTAVSLGIADATAAEGAGTMSFTVTATPAPSSLITFQYTVTAASGDTATAGTDFAGVATATEVTMAAATTSATIAVAVTDDVLVEGDETFTVTLSAPSSGVTLGDGTATGTITDDDALPAKPAGFEATAGNAQVALAWDDPEDASITGYELRYGKVGEDWGSWTAISGAGAATTDHTVLSLENGSEYRFRLRAVNPSGNSVQSAVVKATPQANPAKPVVTAMAGNGQVTLSWQSQPGLAITTWTYQYSTDGGSTWSTSRTVTGAGTTSTVVTGLENDTAYTFRLFAAVSPGVQSAWSDHVTATPKAPAPAAPANFVASPGNTQVALSWDDPEDESISAWQLRYSKEGESWGSWTAISGSNAATTGTTVTDLDNGSTYRFQLRARNSSGVGTQSAVVTATPRVLVKPVVTAMAGDGRVTLSWPAQPNSGVTAWVYQLSINGGTNWKPTQTVSGGGTTSTVVTGLTNGTEYTFRMFARAGSVQSSWSDFAKATPTSAALSIADLTAAEDGTFAFTVTAAPAPAEEISFKYTVTTASGDTATAGTDFTAVTTATLVTMAANATTATITVSVTDDTLDEADETFTVTLSAPSSGVTLGDATATGTITDNDDPPALSLAAPAAVAEGDSGSTDMVFTVTLGATSGREVTVGYEVDSTSTATSGTDFTALAAGTLTFIAGSSGSALVQTVTVSVTGDEADETDETVVLKLRDAVAASLPNPATASGTITDDDASPVLAALTAQTVTVGEDVDVTASATDGDNDPISYVWTRKTGETLPALPDDTTLDAARLTFTTTAAGTYTMTVTASDGNGNEDTAEVTITVAVPLPAKPTGVTATGVRQAVRLRWTDPGNTDITRWEYQYKAGTGNYGEWTAVPSSSATTTTYKVLGLTNGTVYTFKLRAVTSGAGPASDAVTATPAPAPAAPTGLKATPGAAQVLLAWTNPNNASITRYELRQLKAGGSWSSWTAIENSDAATVSHTVTGLENGSEYSFRLRAVNATGNGALSSLVAATPRAVPQPTLTATAGARSVTLSWQALPDAGITSWHYQYHSGDGTWGTTRNVAGGSTTSATVSGLTNGTTYTFRLFARAGSAQSSWSEFATAKPLALPAKPTGVTATGVQQAVRLRWTDPGNTDITAWEYQYKAGTGNYGEWTAVPSSSATTTTYKVLGLTNGTVYTFKLRAVTSGAGPASDAVTATPAPRPAAPTGLKATPGAAQVLLAWTNPNNASITRYELRQLKAGGSWSSWTAIENSDAATVSHTVTGLENGSEYSFRLRAVNATGNGALSSLVAATPRAVPQPTLTATAGDGSVTLSWQALPDAGITSWHYQYHNGDGTWGTTRNVAGGSTTSDTVSGLTNGTTYTFRLFARAGSAQSSWSEFATATPLALPAKPTGVTATGVQQAVRLRWTDPGNTDITRWEYQYKAGTGNYGEWTAVPSSSATTTTYKVLGLTNGTVYTFKLRAVTSGAGPASDAVTATPAPAPAAPTGLKATPGAAQVLLAWTNPNNASITRYELRQLKAGGSWSSWTAIENSDAATVSHTVTGLENGSEYSFRLRAVNATGNGALSSLVAATPRAVPQPTLTATAGDGSVTLSWQALPDAGITSWHYQSSSDGGTTWSATQDVAGGSTTSATVSGLTNDTAYTFRLFARAGSAQSSWSEFATATPRPVAPARPKTFRASPGNARVTLSWADPENASITRYELRYSKESEDWGNWTAISGSDASTTSYAVTGLENGSTYRFRIRARNSGGVSEQSAVVTATPLVVVKPVVTATAGDGRVTLSWPAQPGSGVTAWGYQSSSNDGTSWTSTRTVSGGSTTSTVVTGLTNGTEYTFRMFARAGSAQSSWSDFAKATPTPASLSIADLTAAEDGTFTFTVTAAPAPASGISFKYTVTAASGDTATAGTDFTAVTTATLVTMAANATTATITVAVADDTLDEADETFTVTLSAPTAGVTLGDATATGTITDNDDPPALSLAAPAAVAEGDSGSTDMVFTVTLGATSGREVTVGYAVDSTSTATSGTDFTALAAGTLTFPAGSSGSALAQTVTVSVTGDEADEADETVVLKLREAVAASLPNPATASGTITDDDASPVLAALTARTVTVGRAVDITASATDGDGDTVTYAWTRKAGETTPPLPEDATLDAARLTFTTTAAGTYTMTVTASDGNGNEDTAEVTITVTPPAPEDMPRVVVEPTALTVNEGGGDQYMVRLAGTPPTGEVRVKITSVLAGRDDLEIGTLLFEPYNWNEWQTTTQYGPVSDIWEGYTITLKHAVEAAGTNYADVTAADVTVTVVDTTATLTLATDPAAVAEGEDISLTVTSNRTLTGTLPVKLTFADRGTSGFAAADLPGGLTQVLGANFGGTGGKTGTVTIPTNPDTDTAEGAETYTVTLGDDSNDNGYKLGSDTTADGTLNDGASGTPPTPGTTKGLTVVPMTLTADEGAGAAFTVVLDAAPSADVTVTVAVSAGDVGFTHQGQLDDGSNYGKLTFTTTNWDEPQWVRVWVREDADMEDDADVTLTLTPAGGGYDGVAAATVTVTVTEDDKTMSPELAPPARPQGLTAEAGDGAVTLTWQDPGDPTIRDWQVWFRRGSRQASGWLTMPGADHTTTRHTVSGLKNGKAYRFRVRAVNDAGPGERSERVSATPQRSPTHGSQRGPARPLIAIADAAATEGDELVFALTLSTPSLHPVRVAWEPVWGGSYGTARAGVDFARKHGEAEFPPGITHVAIRLATFDDAHDEGRETFAVRLSNPAGGVIADGEAIGTIINADPLPRAWLGRFGRTVAETALDGIAVRVKPTDDVARASGFQGEGAFGSGTPGTSLGQLLAGSHFTYARGEPTRGSLGFWGRGARRSFDGQTGAVALDGEATLALLGVDYARDHWLAGVAFAQSRSHGGYHGGGAGMAGGVEAALTAAIPYASWRPAARLTLWGAGGRGDGAITLTTGAGETLATPIGWTMAAGGASGELWSFDAGGTLALVSDALWTRTTAARTDGLAGTAAGVGRWRFGLEGSRPFALSGGASITPTLELGARHDRGDAETGTGVELGGGFAWHDPRRGLEIHLDGRALLTHEDGAMKDRGLSASLAYDPRPDSALGLTFALRQDIGGAFRGGLDALFDHDPLAARRPDRADGIRRTVEAGYGLLLFRSRFVGTPLVTYGIATGARTVGIGWQLAPVINARDLSMTIRASQRAEAGSPGSAEHRVDMEIRTQW